MSELVPALDDIVCTAHGRKVLLHVLSPGNTRYFSQPDREIMKPLLAPRQAEDGSITMISTTKKPADVRRKVGILIVVFVFDSQACLDWCMLQQWCVGAWF